MTRVQAKSDMLAGLDGADRWNQVIGTTKAIWGHRPEMYDAYLEFAESMRRSGTISPRLRELLRLRIAFHNQCRTCMAVRFSPDLVSEDLVCSLERPHEADDLTPAERSALRFADLLATDHLAIDNTFYDGMREFFDEGELFELGLICGVYIGIGRMVATWHIVDDLPASFQVAEGTRVTPWGHAETVAGIETLDSFPLVDSPAA